MDEHTSVVEAQALTIRLFQAWDQTKPDTPYANRLVMLAERAHKRRIRRAARCGDSVAQHWLALIDEVTGQ